MRASPHVHVDETGWRIDGRNFWLWAFTDPTFTLYHVDESRGGKVPLKLLGKAYGGVVVADFYSAYNQLQVPKQRCLVHLLREVRESGEADAEFQTSSFAKKLKRWCQDPLELKQQRGSLKKAEYLQKTARLESRLEKLIQNNDPHSDVQRLTKRFGFCGVLAGKWCIRTLFDSPGAVSIQWIDCNCCHFDRSVLQFCGSTDGACKALGWFVGDGSKALGNYDGRALAFERSHVRAVAVAPQAGRRCR